MTEQICSQIRATNLRKPNLGTFLKKLTKSCHDPILHKTCVLN